MHADSARDEREAAGRTHTTSPVLYRFCEIQQRSSFISVVFVSLAGASLLLPVAAAAAAAAARGELRLELFTPALYCLAIGVRGCFVNLRRDNNDGVFRQWRSIQELSAQC
jgi:hypothetical protein